MTGPHPPTSGLIAWFATNPVAANLLMALILLGGWVGYRNMDKEVFPRFTPRQFVVEAEYPGAGPAEVEQSVCVPIEEALAVLKGVEHLDSIIFEGSCEIRITLAPEYDKELAMSAARGKIQAIPRLPRGLERIEVREALREDDDGVIRVALHGDADPLALKRYGERIQADLSNLPGVARAQNYNDQPYEIAVEVSAAKLRQSGLSLAELAGALRRAGQETAGGTLNAPSGGLLLRMAGVPLDAGELAGLPVRTGPDGHRLKLGELAEIREGLGDRAIEWRHNGENGQGWAIYAERDAIAVAGRVRDYVRDMRGRLPPGLTLTTWWDDSESYQQRMDTLIEDGVSGFLLVCLVLTLFLRWRVALWAGAGMLTSLFGAVWLMPVLGVSLNMLSLFGFLLAMGILVDDAIIIGESVHARQQALLAAGEPPARAGLLGAIAGTAEVAVPVTIAVSIALAAFLPGLFLPGWAGQMMRPICLVMLLTLAFSLVEALMILPAHLAVPATEESGGSPLARLRALLNAGLDRCMWRVYAPLLALALRWRYLTVALFLALMALCAALVASDRVRHTLRPDATRDSFWVLLSVPPGSPDGEAGRLARRAETALLGLRAELDARQPEGSPSVLVNVETVVREAWHWAAFWVELSPGAREEIAVETLVRDWRDRIGGLGQGKIDFFYREGDTPYDLEFDLSGDDPARLAEAAEALKRLLAGFPGVHDVVDSAEPGSPELRLKLLPEAERLGLRIEDLSAQLRSAYYGEEVWRKPQGHGEVRVVARLPPGERRSLDQLRALPVRLPDGTLAPLSALADIGFAPGYDRLVRRDRFRVLQVEARVDPRLADANRLYERMETGEFQRLRLAHPGVRFEPGRQRHEQQALAESLAGNTVLALAAIFALIAVPFRSYVKPLIFLLAAPVAWSGAVLAHWALGLPLSMESLVGMIAASGVVVNDSLVLLDHLQAHREDPRPLDELIGEACRSRFRAIFLAFLTNFAGFLPTLMEHSAQSQFLVPMTLSLSAGLLVGMAASLVCTPVCYAIAGRA